MATGKKIIKKGSIERENRNVGNLLSIIKVLKSYFGNPGLKN